MSVQQDLEHIAMQERVLQFSRFDHEAAWKLGSWLHDFAAEAGLPLVIDLRRFEQPLFFAALPGTTPDNLDWVRRKCNTVQRFLRSSYAIGLALEAKNTDLMAKYALPARDYVSHGGSFPLAVEGAGVFGSITVSGLPQRQDHELVVQALCVFLGKPYAEYALPPAEGRG